MLLFVAKLATVAVPFTFKWATDALAGAGTAPVAARRTGSPGLIAAPMVMTLAYGGMRIADGGADPVARRHLRQGGDARGAPARHLTFVHMHELSLRFHLERKTGGLTRVLERGRNGIETIVRMVILQLAPTIVEARC